MVVLRRFEADSLYQNRSETLQSSFSTAQQLHFEKFAPFFVIQPAHISRRSPTSRYHFSLPFCEPSRCCGLAKRRRLRLAQRSPLTLVQEGQQVAALPGALQWNLSIRVFQSPSDRANDAPSAVVSGTLPSFSGKRLAISYEPVTTADQAVIDTAAGAGQTTFSAYLVRFAPKIKLDQRELASGYAQLPGDYGAVSVVIKGPYDEIARDYALTSGDTGVLSLNPAGIGVDTYQSRAAAFNLLVIDYQQFGLRQLAEEMLHQVGLAWWALKHVSQDVNASLMGVIQNTLPSHALMSAPIAVRYFFGIARTASFKTRTIDAKLDYVAAEHTHLIRRVAKATLKFRADTAHIWRERFLTWPSVRSTQRASAPSA
jgi:hypothetical protein